MGRYYGGGLANGFAQGFGLVDDYQRKNRQEERQKQYDARAAEVHGVQMQNYANQQEEYQHNKERRPVLEQQQDQLHGLQLREANAGIALKETQRRNAEFEQARKESVQIIEQVAANGGKLTPDLVTAIKGNAGKNGSYLTAWGGNIEQAIQDNETIHAAFNGQIPPEQAHDAVSRWLQPEVNKVVGQRDQQTGKTITSAAFNDIKPVAKGDGVNVMLTIQYDDGSTAQKPVTELRLAGGNEPLKTVYFEDIFNKHMAERSVLATLRAQPNFDQMKTGLADLYTQQHPGKNQIPAQHRTGLDIFKQMQKDLAAASTPNEFSQVDPTAVRAAQGRLDEFVRANPWIKDYVNHQLPPTMEELVQLAETRTWPDQEGRPGAEAKQRYLQKLQSGQFDLRTAYQGLMASTTDQAPAPTPTDEGGDKGLLAKLLGFDKQEPEQAPPPEPKPAPPAAGIQQDATPAFLPGRGGRGRPNPEYASRSRDTAFSALQSAMEHSDVTRVNRNSNTTPQYGNGIHKPEDKDKYARK